ncbi:MAG: hypothetical protein JOZ54_19565 [Acidobacteria bacterium]|nr:hypothetical protein [Acidobacteriota bacterium]
MTVRRRPWGACYWSAAYEQFVSLTRTNGRAGEGVFFIAPDILWITHADGVWVRLGDELGRYLGDAETLLIAAREIDGVAELIRREGDVYVDRVTSPGASDGTEVVTVSREEMRGFFVGLVAFMRDAGEHGEDLTLNL